MPKGQCTIVRVYDGSDRQNDWSRVDDIYLDSLKDFIERLGKSDLQISETEAKRRAAVAKMIIAECEAADRLNHGKIPGT